MLARLRFIHEVLVGYKVQVQVKGGLTYEGVLHSFGTSSQKDYDVVLLMAEVVRDESKDVETSKGEIVERPTQKLVIHSQDVMQIKAGKVGIDAASVGPVSQVAAQGHEDAGGFGTDASISRGKATGYGRQLERWTPSAADEEDMGANDAGDQASEAPTISPPPPSFQVASAAGKGKDWDQFAAFERMTGAKTTYTEEQYTTALNKNDPRMKALEAEAERIAREIEGQTSTNSHVAEERGHSLDDSGMDEEDKYAGVLRAPPKKTTEGKGLNPNAKAFVPGQSRLSRPQAQPAPAFGGFPYQPYPYY